LLLVWSDWSRGGPDIRSALAEEDSEQHELAVPSASSAGWWFRVAVDPQGATLFWARAVDWNAYEVVARRLTPDGSPVGPELTLLDGALVHSFDACGGPDGSVLVYEPVRPTNEQRVLSVDSELDVSPRTTVEGIGSQVRCQGRTVWVLVDFNGLTRVLLRVAPDGSAEEIDRFDADGAALYVGPGVHISLTQLLRTYSCAP
jgi:hypothetical protein